MKFIKGYEKRYSVNDSGEVFSHLSNKWLKKFISSAGYYTVTLYRENSTIRHPLLVSRLVADAFIDNIDNNSEVNHINFIKTDNSVKNLEWVTGVENIRHTIKHDRHSIKTRFKKGSEHIWNKNIHPSSKAVIEKNSGKTFTSAREAARAFNLPHQYIFNCIKKSGITHGLKFRLAEEGK